MIDMIEPEPVSPDEREAMQRDVGHNDGPDLEAVIAEGASYMKATEPRGWHSHDEIKELVALAVKRGDRQASAAAKRSLSKVVDGPRSIDRRRR